MDKQEFLNAVNAYLNGAETIEQNRIVEDYYEGFANRPDVLISGADDEVRKLGDQLLDKIHKRIE